jgi:magnesium transporter
MLNVLTRGKTAFVTLADGAPLPDDAVWIELIEPTRPEELLVETAMGLLLPTREEMAEIEVSSRLYEEDGGVFMTASLLVNADTDTPLLEPVTFVLAREKLVTIRYVEPRSFCAYIAQLGRQTAPPAKGADALMGLLEAVVDRVADLIERAAADVEAQSRMTFSRPGGGASASLLERLGRIQSLTSKARGSLASLARLVSYAPLNAACGGLVHEHLLSLQHDIVSLSDHANYVSSQITFLLDATLGLIGIEQNQVFKVLAVFSAVLMPPTLIAGVYGMNFTHMPELGWRLGYPLALALMAVAMAAPLVWFKRKGWF